MRLPIAVATLLVLGAPARAHDFFLAPSAHHARPGDALSIAMRVGSAHELDELPRSNRRIVRFEAHLGDAVVRVDGKQGASPAGRVALATPGVATVVYQSTHNAIELAGEKFEAYLREEGLDDVAALRARLGVTATPGSESYARYAKALVTVGDGAAGWDRRVGLPAELVALTDPRAGGTARFQLLFEGKPRAGATVDILRIEKTRAVSAGSAQTDADGQVALAIPGDGVWVVATTLMRMAPEGLEGDWESFWVSLSFETGAPTHTGGCAASDPGAFAALLVLFALRARRRRAASARLRSGAV